MMLSRILWATTLILGLGAATAQAQSLRSNDGPAEYPPSSFKGKQYVDSNGCVYIRAGVGGQVTWVPRVARNRQLVCGYKPTLASSSQGVAPSKAQNKVVVIAPAAPEVPREPVPKPLFSTPSKTVAAAPKVAPRTAPKPVTRPKPVVAATRKAPRAVAPAPTFGHLFRKPAPAVAPRVEAPKRVVRAAPVVVATARTSQRVRAGSIACPNLSPVGREYTRVDGNREVRCGPQAVHPADVSGGRLAQGTRVVPRHVYENNQKSKVSGKVPKGYRAAFKDDRLNTRRAEGTLRGKAKMELVWTNTVPRRLIDRKTRRDVTALFPHLKAPGRVVVSTRGTVKPAKKPKAVVRARAGVQAGAQVKKSRQKMTISTRSAPRAVSAGHRYVQVGTYGVPANSKAAIRKLQRAGLPVRVGKYKKGGKSLKIVLSGPFADANSLSNALKIARRAGFRDAFTRK